MFQYALLVLSLVSTLSCAKAVSPNNIQPPVSRPSFTAPPRLDPSLPSVLEMQKIWALDQLSGYGLEIDVSPSNISTKDAINRGKAWFASHKDASKGIDVDSIQAFLVRYIADPVFPEFNRLSWFIVAPPIMGLQLQGIPAPILTRDTPIQYLWASDFTLIMDDETGEVWGGTLKMQVGHTAPLFTINQFDVVQKYADSYGWWVVWYRTKSYNGLYPPQSVIDDMRF